MIDCCVRIKLMVSLTVYSVVIFSHRYLSSDRINVKTFVFLAFIPHRHKRVFVYFFFFFFTGASTMLNNVFKGEVQ